MGGVAAAEKKYSSTVTLPGPGSCARHLATAARRLCYRTTDVVIVPGAKVLTNNYNVARCVGSCLSLVHLSETFTCTRHAYLTGVILEPFAPGSVPPGVNGNGGRPIVVEPVPPAVITLTATTSANPRAAAPSLTTTPLPTPAPPTPAATAPPPASVEPALTPSPRLSPAIPPSKTGWVISCGCLICGDG